MVTLANLVSFYPSCFKAFWRILFALAISVSLEGSAFAAEEEAAVKRSLFGDALLSDEAYTFLGYISDQFGPRMIGTEGHARSMDYLEERLLALGLEVERQAFSFPGWRRGPSRVEILEPIKRELRTIDLGYVETWPSVEGGLVYLSAGSLDDIESADVAEKVLLLRQGVRLGDEAMERAETLGARGVLMINRLDGGQLLARVSNHHGEAAALPILSVTQEEGLWLKRLLDEGNQIRISLDTRSRNEPMEGTNLIARWKGTSGEKVVLGGHFDSWDLGQGAIDNGLGVAQLLETARLLKGAIDQPRHTIEFVWFDAEEFGLWGSKHYVENVDTSNIRVMINLDMVGNPIAINAMGFDSLLEPLGNFDKALGAQAFERDVINKAWLGSDHHPFILRGIPAVTFNAPLDHDVARYYHDFADTFDKIDKKQLSRACAMIALLTYHFSEDESSDLYHLSEDETVELFRKAKLDERLKAARAWPFDD